MENILNMLADPLVTIRRGKLSTLSSSLVTDRTVVDSSCDTKVQFFELFGEHSQTSRNSLDVWNVVDIT